MNDGRIADLLQGLEQFRRQSLPERSRRNGCRGCSSGVVFGVTVGDFPHSNSPFRRKTVYSQSVERQAGVPATHVPDQETGGAVSLRVACTPVMLQHPLQFRAVRARGAEDTADICWIVADARQERPTQY